MLPHASGTLLALASFLQGNRPDLNSDFVSSTFSTKHCCECRVLQSIMMSLIGAGVSLMPYCMKDNLHGQRHASKLGDVLTMADSSWPLED